jgi:hypothetical protein
MPEPGEPPTLDDVAAELFEAREKGLDPDKVMAHVRVAHNMLQVYRLAQTHAMLNAVQGDLERIDVNRVPGGQTYRAMALHLAAVIDKRGDDDGPSTTAKLADQLTKVMGALTRKGGAGDDDGFGAFQDDISTPD